MIRRLLRCPALGLVVLSILVMAQVPSAQAAEGGAMVVGKIELPAIEKRQDAPLRGKGFVKRAMNILHRPHGFDPRNRMVVVLTGGPVDPADQQGRLIRYKIVGENFESDMLPVVVGGRVEFKNLSRRSPRLYSQSSPELVPEEPISKTGAKTKTITETHKAIDIRDHDSVHFLAHIVAFEHTYFSVIDYDGMFSIDAVPPGTWTVKIWYRDGWVTNLPATTVTIVAKRPTKPVALRLPIKLQSASKAE